MHAKLLLITVLAWAALMAAFGSSAAALSGKQPLVVVLCKFTDSLNEPRTAQAFQDLFSETGAGKLGVFDFWKDVSYGNLDLTGTVVTGWYTVPMTLAQWQAKEGAGGDRLGMINACASQAVNDLKNMNPSKTFNDYADVVVVTNQVNSSEDLFGGRGTITIGNQQYTIGYMDTEWDQALAGIQHESGHSFGLNHSRRLSTSTSDYNDCYDVMSVFGCAYSGSYSYPGQGTGGPGLNAVQVDTQGWFPGGRQFDFNNGPCTQQSITVAALDHAATSGYLSARIPAGVTIANGQNTTTTSDFYYIELRDKTRWDSAIPQDAVILHLRGQDKLSYWVDQAPQGALFQGGSPALLAGSEYTDASRNAYVAVNKIDPSGPSAVVTLGACKITGALTYSGPTSADFNDTVTFAADFLASNSPTAPVPLAPVTFTLGSQTCFVFTDLAGHAACQITINQHPGAYTVSVAFGGDIAYNSASDSTSFTINKEESQVTYTGALSQDYHDPFTASATVIDPADSTPIAGRTVTFTLGAGDTCSAATDGSGLASCSITPSQAAGTYAMTAAFGDIDYLTSTDSPNFAITREETTTAYTGPLVILQGQPVTLKGRLLEDGTTAPAPFGQTMTLRLGSQSCTGATNSAGDASCTIAVVNVPLGPQPLEASFVGDAYYRPSSDTSKQAIVFAFPSRGAFVLGDNTVATSTPLTDVTWWSSSWSAADSLSGGPVRSSFKGFAGSLSASPPSCGGTWTTVPGNSPPPVDSIPSYMGTLVASGITKSGSTFTGNIVQIVVVKTDPGYGSDPGKDGTGTIVATYCK